MIDLRRTFAAVLTLAAVQAVFPGCASNVAEPEESADSTEDALTKGNWTGFTNGQCVHGVYSFYLHRYGISLPGTCAAGDVGICESCGACEIWKSKAIHPPAKLFNQYDWGTTMS